MRSSLIAIGGLFALATTNAASAADLLMPTKAPPPPPAYNWTGFYLGANGGGGWSHDSASSISLTTFGASALSGSSSASGGFAGGQIGFNYELPSQVVLGIEADADWANIGGTTSGCPVYITGAFTGFVAGCSNTSATLNDFGTLRGRLGYAVNNILFYGTGGWAWGNSSGSNAHTCVSGIGAVCPGAGIPFTGGTASFSNGVSGWAAGAGVEWALAPHWTVQLGYLHLQFDDVSTSFTETVTIPGGTGSEPTNISSNHGIDTVRVGLNYRL
jgi:outer membrane immunogenic protein